MALGRRRFGNRCPLAHVDSRGLRGRRSRGGARLRRLRLHRPKVESSAKPAMTANLDDFEKAQEELRFLEERLGRKQREHLVGAKGFTKAGIHKLIARLHEELAIFEGSQEAP